MSVCLIFSTSCTKPDDYKKYTAEGERVYAGKLDSVAVLSGKERIKIVGVFKSDPKLAKCKIYWNNLQDSIVLDIANRTVNKLDYILNIDEGTKNFTIITYDNKGNSSLPVRATGVSYGDAYRSKISNRPIISVIYSAASNRTAITWDAMDNSIGALYTEVEYLVDGNTVIKQTPITDNVTNLDGFNTNTTKFKYRTVFRPDVTSIDTFVVAPVIR